MTTITRESNRIGSLLSSTNRVEAPFVRVELGGYSFGVYETKTRAVNTSNGVVTEIASKYPNYIQSLKVKRLNGTVNQYTLTLQYPITENNDPNFFEKIFSKVGLAGEIKFEYGDSMMPDYVYKDENAVITDVRTSFDFKSSVITYNVDAWSASKLTLSGNYNFPTVSAKPSDEIKRVLFNTRYHLTDVFTGMRNRDLVEQLNLIAADDKKVTLPTCTNMSALEYISVLVSYMTPEGSTNTTSAIKSNVYSLTTYEDTSGSYGGPYFKVQKIQRASNTLNKLCTYDIDIGYPTANVITRFSLNKDDNWAVLFKYNQDLNNSDYLKRINSKGETEYIYSPQLTNSNYDMTSATSSWWTQVTQYPVSATLELKGLLRPTILMQYVKLNVWFYGNKHISSGYYIIKSQVDNIGLNGYFTTLELLRIAPDEDI